MPHKDSKQRPESATKRFIVPFRNRPIVVATTATVILGSAYGLTRLWYRAVHGLPEVRTSISDNYKHWPVRGSSIDSDLPIQPPSKLPHMRPGDLASKRTSIADNYKRIFGEHALTASDEQLRVTLHSDISDPKLLRELVAALRSHRSPSLQPPKQNRFKINSIDYFGARIEIKDTQTGITHKLDLKPLLAATGITVWITSRADDIEAAPEDSIPGRQHPEGERPPWLPPPDQDHDRERLILLFAANTIETLLAHGQRIVIDEELIVEL